MAASSSHCMNITLNLNNKSQLAAPTQKHVKCSFLGGDGDLQREARIRTNKKRNTHLVVTNATPEAAGDLLSSMSLPGIPGLSFPGDNPWIAGVAGLLIGVPLLIQRLVTLSKEVDAAAQTVEKIADAVGKVAEQVDKAAEDIVESLPEGGLKKIVEFVEDIAEETVKDAQMVEDLMDKVEELDDKLDEFLNKQSKGSGTA